MDWDRIRDMLCKADGLAKDEDRICFENAVQDLAAELGWDVVPLKPCQSHARTVSQFKAEGYEEIPIGR